MESRKVKNMKRKNIIAKILEKRREEFIEKLIPLGHNQKIIETVIDKGLTCLDLKLVYEKLPGIIKEVKRAELRQKKLEDERRPLENEGSEEFGFGGNSISDDAEDAQKRIPIKTETIKTFQNFPVKFQNWGTAQEDNAKTFSNYIFDEQMIKNLGSVGDSQDFSMKKLDYALCTSGTSFMEKSLIHSGGQPLEKSEIFSPYKMGLTLGVSGRKNNEGSIVSRSYLTEASDFDGGLQDKSYMKTDNNAICEKVELMPKKIREKFEMKQRERERRLEAQKYKNFENNNELLGHLQKKRVGMDRTLRLNSDQKNCLLCNKNTISIVLMNCGHAYQCKSCYNPKNRVCQVCKSEVFFCVEMQNSDQDAPRKKSKSKSKSPIKSNLQSE